MFLNGVIWIIYPRTGLNFNIYLMLGLSSEVRRPQLNMTWTKLLLTALLTCGIFSYAEGRRSRAPIVFVPGKAGNQLEARLDKTGSYHPHCPTRKDWYRIWMDVWQMLPGDVECWSENLNLFYNTTSGKAFNAPGVEIRVPGWGSTESVEFVDPSWTAWIMGNLGAYASGFIEEMVNFGYTRGLDLRAAPYDFRLAPASQEEYHVNLKLLIETTYEENQRIPIVLIGHSNGGLMALYFLNSQSQEWKDKYIKAFLTVATPYGGTTMLSLMYTSGYDWGIDAIDASVMRDQQRSYETGVFLLPKPSVFGPDEVLIRTPLKNFTAHNYDEYFAVLGTPFGKVMLDNVEEAFRSHLKHPGVDTHCLYGNGQETVQSLVYEDGQFPDTIPKFIIGDGDGTVNINSLAACEQFLKTSNSEHSFVTREIDDVDHLEILSHPRFIRILRRIVAA